MRILPGKGNIEGSFGKGRGSSFNVPIKGPMSSKIIFKKLRKPLKYISKSEHVLNRIYMK